MKGIRGPRIPGKRVETPKKGKGVPETWIPDDFGPRGETPLSKDDIDHAAMYHLYLMSKTNF